ncbi:MAG: hypothetical protein HKN63_07560 [Rhodobacteraceae bacterium]|nr:hypothetical protein [Paracoccaceae bacterium]
MAELSAQRPQLEAFVILSPILGLIRRPKTLADNANARKVPAGKAPGEVFEKMAARYLLTARNALGPPLDRAARLHLGNGAPIHAVHANV